jgi:hypothetical protein
VIELGTFGDGTFETVIGSVPLLTLVPFDIGDLEGINVR